MKSIWVKNIISVKYMWGKSILKNISEVKVSMGETYQLKSISGEKSSVSGENNELVKSISERRFNGGGRIRGE